MGSNEAKGVRELERERYLQKSGCASGAVDVPRILPAGSSDLAEWRRLIEAIGTASRGGHAVDDVRAERRG
jgi:hypothetical protein